MMQNDNKSNEEEYTTTQKRIINKLYDFQDITNITFEIPRNDNLFKNEILIITTSNRQLINTTKKKWLNEHEKIEALRLLNEIEILTFQLDE